MPSSDLKSAENSKGWNALLALLSKGILMASAIILITSSKEISIVKPCDLEKALDSLGLDVTSPCTNNDIKEKSTSLCNWGIGVLVVNFILSIMISFFELMPKKLKLVFLIIVSTTTAISTLSFVRMNTIYLVLKCICVHSMLVLDSFLPS